MSRDDVDEITSSQERLSRELREALRDIEGRAGEQIRAAISAAADADLSRRRAAAQADVKAHRVIIDRLRRELVARAAVAAERDQLSDQVRALQAQLHDTRSALDAHVAAAATVRQELERLRESRSWRYTRAMREAGLVFRALIRRDRAAATSPDPAAAVTTAPREAIAGSAGLLEPMPALSASGLQVLEELRQACARHRQ